MTSINKCNPESVIIFSILLAVNILLGVLIGYEIAFYTKATSQWAVSIYRNTCYLFTSILFLPMLGTFFGFAYSVAYASCWNLSGGAIAVPTLLYLTIGFFFIYYCMAIASTQYEQFPTSKATLARPHSRADIMHILIRAMFVILFSLMKDSGTITMMIMIVGGCNFLAYVFTLYIPYYNFVCSQTRCTFMWIVAFASDCLCLGTLFPQYYRDGSTSYLFFGCLPVVVYASTLALSSWKQYIRECSIKDMPSSYAFELKVRFHMEELELLNQHSDHSLPDNMDHLSPDGMDVEESMRQERFDKYVKEVHGWYGEMIRKFPATAMLFLFWATFHLTYERNNQLAVSCLARAKVRKPKGDEIFIINRYRKFIAAENSRNPGTQAVTCYLAYQKNLKEARHLHLKTLRFQSEFWRELLQPQTNLVKLHAIGEAVHHYSSLALKNYKRVYQLNSKSVEGLRLYGSFLSQVCKLEEQGDALLMKAEQIEELTSKVHQQTGDETHIDLFDDRNGLYFFECFNFLYFYCYFSRIYIYFLLDNK